MFIAPGEAPLEVTARNASAKSILVQWEYVRKTQRNGIILGYKVTYKKNQVSQTFDVTDGEAMEVEIKGLDIFSEYSIKISAYNSVGEGPQSIAVQAMTDESSKGT